MRKTLIALLLLSPFPATSEESWQITALEWARPRHGEWLVRQPALSEAIGQMQQQPQARLQIRYPGGDEGVLWAEELQAWLVALGLASNRIERVPGSSEAATISLVIAP
ncbi:MAG TPA: hypothetical protein VGB35_10480 [Gammaproteobacteria bacterium]